MYVWFDSSSSGSEVTSTEPSVDGKQHGGHVDRVNVVISDVMLLDILGLAQREQYEFEVFHVLIKVADIMLSEQALLSSPQTNANTFPGICRRRKHITENHYL